MATKKAARKRTAPKVSKEKALTLEERVELIELEIEHFRESLTPMGIHIPSLADLEAAELADVEDEDEAEA